MWISESAIFQKALSGFTMIEMIIALMCVSIFVPIIGKCIDVIQFDQSVYVNEMEDIVGIEQLRLYLARGSISIESEHSLLYQTDKEYYVSIVNNHLTLQFHRVRSVFEYDKS